MELSNKSLIKNFPHAITICSVGEFQYLELVRQLYNSNDYNFILSEEHTSIFCQVQS